MTKSEYRELVEFLGPKFDKIDARFEAIDQRLDAIDHRLDAVEQRLTRVELLGEEDRDRTRILAEALGSLDRKVDALGDRMSAEFLAIRSEMAVGFASVRRELAEGFHRLDIRVTRLEASRA